MKKTRSPAGQLLIITLLILAFVMTCASLLVSFSTRLQHWVTDSNSLVQVDQVAQAAFAQVRSNFESHPELWQRAVLGDTLSDQGYDARETFVGLHQIPYTVEFSHLPTLASDQLKVTVKVLTQGRVVQKSQLYQALWSRRTLGVDLPDSTHAPAALYLLGDADVGREQLEPSELVVHWGSIVCFGTLNRGPEANVEQFGHFPRKFCKVGYHANSPAASPSDSPDVWIGTPASDPVDINVDAYKKLAQSEFTPVSGTVMGKDASGGYVDAPGQHILFQSIKELTDTRTAIFYLNTSVHFESNGIDLGHGAMIITQNAVFEEHGSGKTLELHVPVRAAREYLSLPPGSAFPCAAKASATCSSSSVLEPGQGVDFRGFLYVQGDLSIRRDTVIAGVVRVDGRLRIDSGKKLIILFDDQVSHSILTTDPAIQQQIISQPLS